MGPDPHVFAVIDRHRRHCTQTFVERIKEALTASNKVLDIDAIAKLKKADAAIFESRT
jgi:hypothetical protein